MEKVTGLQVFYFLGSVLGLMVMFFYWLDAVVYNKGKRRKAGV